MAFEADDPEVRDKMVAYVSADDKRLRVVKALERRAEPLTTKHFYKMFWGMSHNEVLALLQDIQKRGVITSKSEKNGVPESWELTVEGNAILYALGAPRDASEWHPPTILSTLSHKVKKLLLGVEKK